MGGYKHVTPNGVKSIKKTITLRHFRRYTLGRAYKIRLSALRCRTGNDYHKLATSG